jgi:hypothetical protein
MQLSVMTGYYKEAVHIALLALAQMGLAERRGRYDAWQLTIAARQLPLFTQAQLEGDDGNSTLPSCEGGKPTLPLSSSSSDGCCCSVQQQQLLLPGEGGKSTLPPPPSTLSPDATDVAELLVRHAACPRVRAQESVARAVQLRHVAKVEIEFWRWLAYCNSEAGRGINNPGAFIAAKLARHEDCPPGVTLTAAALRRVKALLETLGQKFPGEERGEHCPHCGDPLRDDESLMMAGCGHVVHEECADVDCPSEGVGGWPCQELVRSSYSLSSSC